MVRIDLHSVHIQSVISTALLLKLKKGLYFFVMLNTCTYFKVMLSEKKCAHDMNALGYISHYFTTCGVTRSDVQPLLQLFNFVLFCYFL